ncbi:Predicted arabinose efflux permease, MFS family [Mitsuaria sp. PDC51]|uniref:MFS transporter n=1 Tax=Mitsuaria sp. PDC51 TaxID=1881035 RepID=UPI0008EEAE1A|nr:MFS transporter [Mitsuaria sp. PDC51]SFR92528.1 Predicted arabinose efflux permease, MFS family [Mitsuaria sp. PDC51]
MRILLYYLCGVFAAAQLGKLAALSPPIARELQLGLAAMAALTSLLEVCGATLGGVAGRWLPRVGLRSSLSVAVLALAIGAAASAFAQDLVTLALARLVESLGYLAIVVAAPVLIARAAEGRRQAAAMALWSTFVPVGMAVGAWAYAWTAGAVGWRLAQALSVAGGLLLWVSLRAMAAGDAATRRAASATSATAPVAPAAPAPPPSPGATGALLWALVAAFGAYAVAEVGLLALLPSLLTQGGMPLATAGGWTAAAALANVPASAIGAWLLKRRGALSPAIAVAMAVSLGLSGLLFLAALRDGGQASTQALLAIAVNAASGVFPSLVFALLPLAARAPERLALASGRLTQFGASGALLGPPLMGAVVERWGWSAAGGLALALSALAIPLALFAWRRLAQSSEEKPDACTIGPHCPRSAASRRA